MRRGTPGRIVTLVLIIAFVIGCDIAVQPQQEPTFQTATATLPAATTTLPAPIPEPPPTATIVPTTPSNTWALPQDKTLADFDAYRLISKVSYSLGESSGSMSTTIEVTRDPQMRRTTTETLSRSAGEEERHISEIIEAGDTTHMRVDGQPWVSFPAGPATQDVAQDWLGGFDHIFETCAAECDGTTEFNGLSVREYRLDAQCIADSQAPAVVRSAEGKVWVSIEHDLVVRATLVLDGSDTRGKAMRYELEAQVLDLNSPLVIQAPTP